MTSIYTAYPEAARLVIEQRLRDADHERRRRLVRRSRPWTEHPASRRHTPS